jgi:hypothetical protein
LSDRIRANWRAAIIPPHGERPLYGRLVLVGKRSATVQAEHNLPPGYVCRLALMLPKDHPDDANRFIEGDCVVRLTVLSGSHFHINLQWQGLSGASGSLLDEQICRYSGLWRNAG